MLLYTQREETWPVTKMELEGRGVGVACSPPRVISVVTRSCVQRLSVDDFISVCLLEERVLSPETLSVYLSSPELKVDEQAAVRLLQGFTCVKLTFRVVL